MERIIIRLYQCTHRSPEMQQQQFTPTQYLGPTQSQTVTQYYSTAQQIPTHLQQPIMQQAIIHTSQIPTSGSQTPCTIDSINFDTEDSNQSDDDQLS
jgi:hypothetical protein